MNKRKIIYVIGITVAIALVAAGGAALLQSEGVPSTFAISAVSPQDAVKGENTAAVTIIEFSDFQCPACKAYAPVVRELVASSGGSVRLVYRHFPLPQHANAKKAAAAAEAAGRQGKFWEMHDMLFERQNEWSGGDAVAIFEKYAGEIGISVGQFRGDIGDKSIAEKIENNFREGTQNNVDATPSFFVNGTKIANPKNIDAFRAILEEAKK